MGIESRDYIRNDRRPSMGWSAGGGPDVVKGLIIANVVVFVLQLVWTRPVAYQTEIGPVIISESVIQNWLQLSGEGVARGHVWRLLTYAFCHDTDSVWHILMNMYILFLTGRAIQHYYGSREFLLFYLAAAAVSGLGFLSLNLMMGRESIAIGASGSVTAVLIMYALFHPHEVWRILGVFPIQVMWIAILMVIYDLYPVLAELGGRQQEDSVAHSAHLAGYLFGYLYHRYNWRLESLLGGLRRPRLTRLRRPRTKLRVYHPETEAGPDDLEQRVDALLQKVHEQGESSLTEAERAFLTEASRRYRNKS